MTPSAEPFNFTASPCGLDENVKTLHVMLDEIIHVAEGAVGDAFEAGDAEVLGAGVHPLPTITMPVDESPHGWPEGEGPGEAAGPPNCGGIPFFPRSQATNPVLRTVVAKRETKKKRTSLPSGKNYIHCITSELVKINFPCSISVNLGGYRA